jgi:hypothetical protein
VSAAFLANRLRRIDWFFILIRCSGIIFDAVFLACWMCSALSMLGLFLHGFPEQFARLDAAASFKPLVEQWWNEMGGDPALHLNMGLVAILFLFVHHICSISSEDDEDNAGDWKPTGLLGVLYGAVLAIGGARLHQGAGVERKS